MDKTMQTALMKDFTAEQMGHKPATWCRQCSEVVRSRKGKSCTDHREIRCDKCKTKITEAHVCLDFVGHADVRARLCEVDPEWTWTPFEFPGTGSLVLNDGQPVGLWIHLTIGGVSKPGYGSCEKGKSEAVKELIGDAIRNAGLSFGIAWKLWAKGERSSNDSASANGQQQGESFENATPATPATPASRRVQAEPPAADSPWVAEHLTLIAEMPTAEAGRALWRKVAAAAKDRDISRGDAKRLQDLITARITGLRKTAPASGTYGLKPEDDWLSKVQSIADVADADAATADVAQQMKSGAMTPERAEAVTDAIDARMAELAGKAAA